MIIYEVRIKLRVQDLDGKPWEKDLGNVCFEALQDAMIYREAVVKAPNCEAYIFPRAVIPTMAMLDTFQRDCALAATKNKKGGANP